jgi:DNA-directed RNA polymerase subunit RPC12/RpoP
MSTAGKTQFACSGCGKTVAVAVEHAGKRGRCPNCGQVVPIPAASPAVTSDEDLAFALLKKSPEPERTEAAEHELGPSLPLDLARRGWRPYRFKNSNVVVFLPETMAAAFGPDGVLHGSTTGKETEFSATLHGDFEYNAQALEFVKHLAEKKGRKIHDVGTYRYFYDPTDAPSKALTPRFWVIGIPGAMVVVSIVGTRKGPVSEALQEVRDEIPHIVGELL